MSKGNILQGQASGKLGDTVLMVRNGKQIARVYTTAGARSGDAASEAARLQRVKFGSASNQWNCYKYVCTRMYRKGRKTTQSDYNYFVKRNNYLLPYLTKAENADGVHMLQPGQFSEGNLGRIELVHSFNPTAEQGSVMLQVADTQAHTFSSVGWQAKLSVLKAALRVSYPNARKVTFLLSIASDLTLTDEAVSFISQQVAHYPVVIDLFAEIESGENDKKVSEYFYPKIGDESVSVIIETQSTTSAICYGNKVFRLYRTSDSDVQVIGKLGVLVFATDDNASDCYTTILPSSSVDPVNGVYSLWASYRSQDSLQIAADSYGYQTGVMRDFVASAGNDLTEAAVTYAKVLRSVDSEAADAFEASIASAGGAKARVIRSIVESQDD